MLSTETLDQIVYIFGLNSNTYNLINEQQFIYKGRLVTINDTLPDDNCMGSGTTAVACIATNRNYIGFEMDTNCFNLANQRIEQHLNPIQK